MNKRNEVYCDIVWRVKVHRADKNGKEDRRDAVHSFRLNSQSVYEHEHRKVFAI